MTDFGRRKWIFVSNFGALSIGYEYFAKRLFIRLISNIRCSTRSSHRSWPSYCSTRTPSCGADSSSTSPWGSWDDGFKFKRHNFYNIKVILSGGEIWRNMKKVFLSFSPFWWYCRSEHPHLHNQVFFMLLSLFCLCQQPRTTQVLTFKVGGTGGKVFFSSKYILRGQIELANYLATQPISLFNDPFSSKGPPGPLSAGFLHLRQRVPHDETLYGDLGEFHGVKWPKINLKTILWPLIGMAV